MLVRNAAGRKSGRGARAVALLVMVSAVAGAALACGGGGARPARSPEPTANTAVQTQLAVATVDATIAAQYGPPLVKVSEAGGRTILAEANSGLTLYFNAEDVPASGYSHCIDACATTWPPLVVPFGEGFQIAGLGIFGSIVREDGYRQVLYRGRPLYLYAGDKAPGDTNGDGIDGHWSVAVP